MGRDVEFAANGGTAAGYLAEPEGEESAPALVVRPTSSTARPPSSPTRRSRR